MSYSIRSHATKSAKIAYINNKEAFASIRNFQRFFTPDAEEGVEEVALAIEGTDLLPAIVTQDDLNRRALKRWMLNRLDVIHKVGLSMPDLTPLMTTDDDGESFHERDWDVSFDSSEFKYIARLKWWAADARGGQVEIPLRAIVFTRELNQLGVYTPHEGDRFLNLYLREYNPARVWNSSKQIPQQAVAKVALSREYDALPEWVIGALLKYAPEHAKIGGDRVGDVWRLIPCAKAWKWAPLPKNIAEKIGKRSPKFRMLASAAWEAANRRFRSDESGDWNIPKFWEILAWLSKQDLLAQIHFIANHATNGWSQKWRWQAFLAESLKLPYEEVEIASSDRYEATEPEILRAVVRYSTDPKTVEEASNILNAWGCCGDMPISLAKVVGKQADDFEKMFAMMAAWHDTLHAAKKSHGLFSSGWLDLEDEATLARVTAQFWDKAAWLEELPIVQRCLAMSKMRISPYKWEQYLSTIFGVEVKFDHPFRSERSEIRKAIAKHGDPSDPRVWKLRTLLAAIDFRDKEVKNFRKTYREENFAPLGDGYWERRNAPHDYLFYTKGMIDREIDEATAPSLNLRHLIKEERKQQKQALQQAHQVQERFAVVHKGQVAGFDAQVVLIAPNNQVVARAFIHPCKNTLGSWSVNTGDDYTWREGYYCYSYCDGHTFQRLEDAIAAATAVAAVYHDRGGENDPYPIRYFQTAREADKFFHEQFDFESMFMEGLNESGWEIPF